MQLISTKHLVVSETLPDLLVNLNSREMILFHQSYAYYKITFVGEKKPARCAFCCWVNSHPRRGTSYFQNTSANFLEKYFRRKPKETKYFRRKPKETKKLMADGLDAVLRLVQCSLGLDPLGERTSKVLAFTVVRGNVRERMLPRCICCTHKQCCSVCLSVQFFSVQHLPSFFPLECR